MSRTKKKVIANVTLEQAQEASAKYTNSYTKLTMIDARMNEEINTIKRKYQDRITDLKGDMEEPTEVLQVYAREQKKTWGKKKSMELLHTVIGFRTGNPKVEKSKKFTWEGITDLVKGILPEFIRTKDELNKEAILALKEDDDQLAVLKEKCYISVVQDEAFYVEPKKEEVAELV